MGNIKNFNFSKTSLKITNNGFMDFYLANDDNSSVGCDKLTTGDCSVVWYDFNNQSIFPNNNPQSSTIYSLTNWNGATNEGYLLDTVGLTGIDNGLISYTKDISDTNNVALLNALTGSTLNIPRNDTRLHLSSVSGMTGNFTYPIEYVSDTTPLGGHVKLTGGFYQGYYKLDGISYEVLPVRVNQSWSVEFWLNPSSLINTSNTTLNVAYPNNKGIFFYMGTRAENKFWNTFEGLGNTTPNETDVVLLDDTNNVGIPLNPPLINVELVTNQFLIYGRADKNKRKCGTCGGNHDGLGTQTVCSYTGGGINVVTHSQVKTNFTNPFLVYGRASKHGRKCGCGGNHDGLGNETACSFSGFTQDQKQLDYKLDIIDNALAFRIKDDGSIGYRLLTVTGQCINDVYVSGTTIKEEYSIAGVVSPDEWSYLVVKFTTNYMDDCDIKSAKPRKGKLLFYVNSRLKFVVNDFDEVVAKRLNDNRLKQVGVPFNISIGGGTQGLLETQTFDGADPSDIGLPLEVNFAGSFIGSISEFKFNICNLSFCNIVDNYKQALPKYINSFNKIT